MRGQADVLVTKKVSDTSQLRQLVLPVEVKPFCGSILQPPTKDTPSKTRLQSFTSAIAQTVAYTDMVGQLLDRAEPLYRDSPAFGFLTDTVRWFLIRLSVDSSSVHVAVALVPMDDIGGCVDAASWLMRLLLF